MLLYLICPFWFHTGESRTPKATKMDIFLSTVNDFQGLTVVTKNVAVDGTDVLDPRDRFYIKF